MENKHFCLLFFLLLTNISFQLTAQNNFRLQKDADSLFDSGKFTEAAPIYIRLFDSNKKVSKERAIAAEKVAHSYRYMGKYDEAIKWYNQALNDYRKTHLLEGFYLTQQSKSISLTSKGDDKQAIRVIKEVVFYFKKKDDSLRVASALSNLGLNYYNIEDYNQATKVYLETIRWIGEKDDKLKAMIYNQLGNLAADGFNNERKALAYYKKSLHLKLKSKARGTSISASYNNIGLSHKNLGHLDSAMYYYQKSLSYVEKSNDVSKRINPLINIANLQKRQGDFTAALKTYQKGLAIKNRLSIGQQVLLLTNVAMNYTELRKYDKALEYLKIAEELAYQRDNIIDLIDIHREKALAYYGLNMVNQAYQEQKTVTKLSDSLNRLRNAESVADLMLKYESVQKDNEILSKDNEILEHEHKIQQSQIELRNRTVGLITTIGLFLLIGSFLFYLYKRKGVLVKQAELKLNLAAEKERVNIQAERLRISRELHDNIGSYLTLINVNVEQLQDVSHQQLDKKLPEIQKTLSLSIRELRKTVWLLNTDEISIEAFIIQLRNFFKPFNTLTTKISIKFNGNTDLILSDIQATHFFRILQEAVNNSYKYANAKNIQIIIEGKDKTYFSISDDGIGFKNTVVQQGNGIRNMRSRVGELHGEIEIKSEINKGTIVTGYF